MKIERLQGLVRNYAWGSHSYIASLQGRPSPTAQPEAELWLGAHPSASAELLIDGQRQSLRAAIAANPTLALGDRVARHFESELPFLLKVLAAERPLSLQVHPSREQAKLGFAAEDAAGIPLGARERCYQDRNHKPELIIALTPFSVLCGFRSQTTAQRLFQALGLEGLAERIAGASQERGGLREVFETIMTLPADEQRQLVEATVAATAKYADSVGEFQGEFAWSARLAQLHPGDIGIVGALLLNLVELQPYQGIYLPEGNLHAYLAGAGVEIMASSDNVLRCGFTEKHIDVAELLRVLDFTEHSPEPLIASRAPSGERVYQTPTEEFRLSLLEVERATRIDDRCGPEILLVIDGTVSVQSSAVRLELGRGESAFIPGSAAEYSLSGLGTVFRARVGALS